jgi:predicted nucleic acid-binding protein
LRAYCDTSFLVSLYTPDANSQAAAAEARRSTTTLFISPLVELELTNALQLRVFRKELTKGEARAAYVAIQKDLAAGVYSVQPLSAMVFDTAKRISLQHTAGIGSRSLDVLHVAAALAMSADVLLCFDGNQRKLANAAGLRAGPEIH